MLDRMRVLRVARPGSIELDQAEVPVPGVGEVVVRVTSCGICGTDLHIIDGEFPPAPYPLVPGHEFGGVVSAVGSSVDAVGIGDRVAVDPSLFCGQCRHCRTGRGNLCLRWGAIGDTTDGGFAEFVKVPATNVYPVPDHISNSAAALIEPLSCAVHAMDRIGIRAGESACVLGAGTMGLLLTRLLRYSGADPVKVVDRQPHRLDRATDMGATSVSTMVEASGVGSSDGFDIVIDATGVVEVIEAGLSVVRRGGRMMIFGVAPSGSTARIDPFRIYNDEISIIGSMAVLNSYSRAVDLMASGLLDAASIVSHTFPLEDHAEAFRHARAGTGLKVQLVP